MQFNRYWLSHFNPNKLFDFLSIRRKLIIAFTLLTSVPLTVIGLVGIYNNIHSMQMFALENLTHDVKMINERANSFLTNVQQDIYYLTQAPIFLDYVSLTSAKTTKVEAVQWLLTKQISLFATVKKVYYQIYFIDPDGNERFKIRYQDSIYVALKESELSDRRHSFYFLLTQGLKPWQLAFIPAELVTPECSKVAAISFAIRVANREGKFAGILVADVFARDLFRLLERPSILRLHRKIAIVSSEGYYVYHSEKKKNWNRLLATRESKTLFAEYPQVLARHIISGESGIIPNIHNEILAYAPLFSANFPGSNSYYIFESVPRKFILRPARHFALIFAPLLLLFILISVSFGYLATSQLAGPIRKLQKGAEIIARGNYNYRLHIETNDEIEQLAHQFNQMARAIQDRENLLEKHRKKLEEMVAQRTRELQNEKEKLQAILDNVPSALILVDQDQTIISASAAIKNITHMPPESFIGKKCFEVYFFSQPCDLCPQRERYKPYSWQPFVKEFQTPNGDCKFIEHMTIPITLNHNLHATIEILTDVTERRKLESHLLKMEKLAATGEMSAVIAHEMRNSLTSLKMILQLQTEKAVNPEDRQSLEVAFDSLLRMEEILNNLLRFAKPSPFEYQRTYINDIIEECLVFIQPQLSKKKIEIVRDLGNSIPSLILDVNHVKEALINILLNAIQAIEQEGKIRVRSQKIRLSKSMEDFAYTDQLGRNIPQNSYKVVMTKGTEVAMVQIQDTGMGIEKKDMDKIFDPFFTTKLTGTGLGLATTKRIINQHGGLITVKSAPGKGSTFTIYIPIREKS